MNCFSNMSEVYPENNPYHWNEKTKKWTIPPLRHIPFRPYEYGYSLPRGLYYFFNTTFMIITGRWHCCTVVSMMEHSGEEIYDRLITEWATVGIVASLLLSFTYPMFTTKIDNPNNITFGGMDGAEVVALLSFVSMILFIVGIVGVLIMSMALMTIPKPCTAAFVTEFSYFITLPEVNIIGGLMVFAANTVLTGMVVYGNSFSFILSVIVVVAGGYCITMLAMTVLMLDRKGGLWEYGYFLKNQYLQEMAANEAIDNKKKLED